MLPTSLKLRTIALLSQVAAAMAPKPHLGSPQTHRIVPLDRNTPLRKHARRQGVDAVRMGYSPSYRPHQGKAEQARRLRQIAKGQLKRSNGLAYPTKI